MDFDRALEKCGNYGRFQFVVLLLYGFTNFMASMHYYSQTLITFTPDHWCYHEKLENKSFKDLNDIYKNFSKPHCTLLDYNEGVFEPAEVGECRKWFYMKENGYESITTELNLVCGSAYKSAVGQSFYFLGAVIGTISFGVLADRIGRLPSICLTTITGGLGDFLSSFVNSVELFALTRFICGLATDTFFVLMYILTFEYLRPQKRTFGINIIAAIFYGTGLVLSPWFALWVKSWRYYLLIASVPVLLFLLYPLLICESASWLLTREKYDRAVKCLKRVAKFNGRQVEEKVFDEFVDYYKQKALEEQKIKNSDTFWGMFRTPRLRKFTIILLIKSIIVTMSFDIISRNVEGLGSSPFKLFSFTSVIYVPAGLTIIAFQNVIGRKGMATTSLLGGSIITAVTGFLIAYLDPNSNSTLLAIMVGLGRYGAVVAYDAEVQYCTEIVPTSVRGRAVANIHVLGYGFSFLNSYVIYLGNYYKPLPTIFISIIMLIGAALCLCLPETLNQKLPETLSDGEKFGLDEKWYYFPCFSRRKEKLVKKSVEEKFGCTNNIDITAL
ncbi:organic cation transporter-like protein isoform X1 [Lucilia sericata]|uniref:organic cation transporter-like protein isoform X1 n=1 Tax=Lucilia sericata TaxID=13632 RepID=UPI0018A87D7D|nr:organic cation transporter-like protein isoform X1 [Lucilia sericata]